MDDPVVAHDALEPNSPVEPHPQQYPIPPLAMAQLCHCPRATSVTPVRPERRTGTFESFVEPEPSVPKVLFPQQYARPAVVTPQVWA
jgi:hypothetical protein